MLATPSKRARDWAEEMGSSHRFAVGTVIAWEFFGVRLGHRDDMDGLEMMLMLMAKNEADQTKLVLTSARAGAPKRGARARALI